MVRNVTVRIVVLAGLLFGCEKHVSPVVSSPHEAEANRLLNTVVTSSNREQIAAQVSKCLGLSGEQQKLFATALLREQAPKALIDAAFGVPQPAAGDRTVSRIIDEERLWEAAGEAEKQRRNRLQQTLREVLAVHATSMSDAESKGGYPVVKVEYVVENKSNREIRSFEGFVYLRNQAGHDLDMFSVNGTKGLKPGEKRTQVQSSYEPSLRGIKLSDLTVEWSPYTIDFADGHTLDKNVGEK